MMREPPWSPLQKTPWGPTGDRHVIKFTPRRSYDCRLSGYGSQQSDERAFCSLWVGNYKDLLEGTSGQYKIKLLHSYAGSDCGYPGLEILPDGTIVAITYVKMRPGPEQHSIVGVRFKLEETDKMLY
ncbi:hypothetical protein NXW60_08620 [Bacteroides fragilis]|nr:hypothetical protein NXW60_08620 [Bacteroides fragilis]